MYLKAVLCFKPPGVMPFFFLQQVQPVLRYIPHLSVFQTVFLTFCFHVFCHVCASVPSSTLLLNCNLLSFQMISYFYFPNDIYDFLSLFSYILFISKGLVKWSCGTRRSNQTKKIYRMDMLGYNVRCNFFLVKVRGFIMKKIGICLGRSTYIRKAEKRECLLYKQMQWVKMT